MLGQQVHRLGDLGGVGGVVGVAQLFQSDADGVPGVVEHEDIAGILFVPEGVPGLHVVGGVHHGGIIDDAQDACHVGDGIEVFRVIFGIFETGVHIVEVGDISEVQGLQHVLLDHLTDHVVRGDDNVVARGAAGQLAVKGLVGVVGLVVDSDASLGGEVGENGLVDIFAPVIDVDLSLLFCRRAAAAGGQREGQSSGQGKGDESFQFASKLLSCVGATRR